MIWLMLHYLKVYVNYENRQNIGEKFGDSICVHDINTTII